MEEGCGDGGWDGGKVGGSSNQAGLHSLLELGETTVESLKGGEVAVHEMGS